MKLKRPPAFKQGTKQHCVLIGLIYAYTTQILYLTTWGQTTLDLVIAVMLGLVVYAPVHYVLIIREGGLRHGG